VRAGAQGGDRAARPRNRGGRLVGHAPADGGRLLSGCHCWHHAHQKRRAREHTKQIARHVLCVPRRRVACKNNMPKNSEGPVSDDVASLASFLRLEPVRGVARPIDTVLQGWACSPPCCRVWGATAVLWSAGRSTVAREASPAASPSALISQREFR